jgi:SAM-dependent methyltransferase
MSEPIKLTAAVLELLRCPRSHHRLELQGGYLRCTDSACAASYPIVDGVPILINEATSLFSVQDFLWHRDTFFSLRPRPLQRFLDRITPSISLNVKSRQNYAVFTKALLQKTDMPRVLVVGCGVLGEGLDVLFQYQAVELVETDVSFGPRVMAICDAHDLPFDGEAFDGLVSQAVLEHVADPYRCVAEFHRVLKPRGLVYAETPFMQQVHGGRYDFTRFTHLGHRRLFRGFEEIDSGAVCGPGMALAWSYLYFFSSFARSRVVRRLLQLFASLTSFYLKYFDRILIDRPAALDAASACYFMGCKSDQMLSDRELIQLYKGV